MGNLGGKVTSDVIRAEFEKFGQIASLEMSPDNSYCFIRFVDENEDAHSTAMDALNGKKIDDVELLICMD